MLTTLRIRNFALVAELTLEFPAGLVVVSGETGAGKSIVLGALNLLLGQRADRQSIRSGADACTVEAVFNVSALSPAFHALLAESGLEPCEEQALLLKRTVTGAGANRQFVNGTPTTLASLAAVGDWLVDVHGPHEHQSLLQPARQLAILDAYAGLEADVQAFTQLVRRRANLDAERAALAGDDQAVARQIDLLRFQVREIAEAQLAGETDNQTEVEHARLANAARLLQLNQTLQSLLGEDDPSVLSHLGTMGRLVAELQRLDPTAENLGALHEQATATLHELRAELTAYGDRLELDPARLEAIEQRLHLLQNLKRKYGPTLEAVLDFASQARRKLEQLEGRETEIARLDRDLAGLDEKLLSAGRSLSTRRRQAIPPLTKAVTRELTRLGFTQSRFDVTLESAVADRAADPAPPRPGLTGYDTLEFLFAPNPGEPPRPLRAIASSGEMARVMLAIKTVLAAEDQVPVLIFDEVDANVGGQTAQVVGRKMRDIARHRQVFCITHLAPVAAAAHAHFLVHKEVRDGRTFTRMQRLGRDEQVNELARMLGGPTEAAQRHARALLDSQEP